MSGPRNVRSFRDLTGLRFGRLTVVGVDKWSRGKRWWFCVCDCGAEKSVRADGLKCGDYVSCGCKKIDQLRVHGATGTPEHKAWMSMIERCHTETHSYAEYYGARGIQVCDEWRASFTAFLDHIGPRPGRGYSVDRIDNNGNYEPGNVRWATPLMQANNRRPRGKNRKKKDVHHVGA